MYLYTGHITEQTYLIECSIL